MHRHAAGLFFAVCIASCTAPAPSAPSISGGAIAPATEPHAPIALQNEVYSQPDGAPLHADALIPPGPGPYPAVLLLHSGSWRRGDKERVSAAAAEFVRSGFVAVSLNYRLSDRARFPAQLEDARAALAWTRANADRLRVAPDRIGVMGYSAGGHLALLLGLAAAENEEPAMRPRAVVGAAAPSDLWTLIENPAVVALLGGRKSEMAEQYHRASPIRYASADDPPTLLLHGVYDAIVPVEQSRRMAAALQRAGAPVELRELPHGHTRMTVGYNELETRLAIEFFERTLL